MSIPAVLVSDQLHPGLRSLLFSAMSDDAVWLWSKDRYDSFHLYNKRAGRR